MMRPRFPLEDQPKSYGAFTYGAPFLAFLGAGLFVVLAGSLAWAGAGTSHFSPQGDETKGSEDLLTSSSSSNSETSQKLELRARFVEALSDALYKARVPHQTSETHDGTSWIQFQKGTLQFPLGSAELSGEKLKANDRIGMALEQASLCLGKTQTDRSSHNVFLGSISPTPCAKKIPNLFQCDKDFQQLDLESVLLEGHADGHAYQRNNGKFRDNLDLSTGRGEAALRRLYTCSPNLAQMNNGQGQALFGVGGQSSQRYSKGSAGLDEMDRRVEIKLHWKDGIASATSPTEEASGSDSSSLDPEMSN